jgi:hypothetical protein
MNYLAVNIKKINYQYSNSQSHEDWSRAKSRNVVCRKCTSRLTPKIRNENVTQYSDSLSPEDGSTANFRNVVHINHTSDNGQPMQGTMCIATLTTKRDALGRPQSVASADSACRSKQLEASFTRVRGHSLRPQRVIREKY